MWERRRRRSNSSISSQNRRGRPEWLNYTMDGSESLRDPRESSIAPKQSYNGASNGHMSREDSHGVKGEHSDPSVLSSGREQQDAVEHHATHGGTSDGGGHFRVCDMLLLRNAIKLQKLFQVSYIYVNGEELGNKELSALVSVLASDEMCALFQLSCYRFKDDQGKEIIDALNARNFPTLQEFSFIRSQLGTESVEAIGRALGSGALKNLIKLVLTGTRMNDGDVATFAKVFQLGDGNVLPSLKHLDLSYNSFTEVGFQHLGEALKSGCNLKELRRLYLSNTGMNDKGMEALAKMFRNGETSLVPNLERLEISHNSFTKVGLQHLAEALKSGILDSLKELDVRECPQACSEEAANIFVSALQLNNQLTVNVIFEWSMFPAVDRLYENLRMRNSRQMGIMAGLHNSPSVQAVFGKVYLCGSPGVGKTTLSNSFQKTFFKALWTSARSSNDLRRTRGIDVSQFSNKGTKGWRLSKQKENPITLIVWDMAGQGDYHLVHHSFFPDLSFSQAKATTFLVVCTSRDLVESEEQLKYWLRYIASSCNKSTPNRRQVFVLLNRIGGQKVQGYPERWKHVLEGVTKEFKELLHIQKEFFFVDVRKRHNVQPIKKCLLCHSRKVLKNEKVPKLCQDLQQSLPLWSKKRKEFPVLRWREFCDDVQELTRSPLAAKYLHEIGALIHIDKRSRQEQDQKLDIPGKRLVVVNPNWICTTLVGALFLSPDMLNEIDCQENLFRDSVNKTTGSIAILDFKEFFKPLQGGKSENKSRSEWETEDLITILVWLGLCYKGHNQNLFIPALIDENRELGELWPPQSLPGRREDPWVMGFSVQRIESEKTLAPMSLWHKFQVELAQTREFNCEIDNDFVCGRNFISFTVDDMNVLILVDAKVANPIFDEISMLVKPVPQDKSNANLRKQLQVDLANDLLETLLRLWDTVCPSVEYSCRVVWPWPVSQFRPTPAHGAGRNLEVTELKKLVQEHGLERTMAWPVGLASQIRADQLLSTNDKEIAINSVATFVRNDINILEEATREAVHLRILPPEVTEESGITLHRGRVPTQPAILSLEGVACEESDLASNRIGEAYQPSDKMARTVSTSKGEILKALKEAEKNLTTEVREARREVVDEVGKEVREARREVVDEVGKVAKKLNDVGKMLREGFTKVLNEQTKVLGKLQETQRFLIEVEDRTCPNLIYLADIDSGGWAKLKQALSPSVSVVLRFACEAMYGNYKPHKVQNQRGVDVSALKPLIKRIVPWLKASLIVFLTSAKIATNVVIPGLGMILPDMREVSQASSLLAGIEWATDYAYDELNGLIREGFELDPTDPLSNPRDVYGKSRAAITELIENLTSDNYEDQFGLRKVCLLYRDRSFHGIVWICTECHRKFQKCNLVSEVRI